MHLKMSPQAVQFENVPSSSSVCGNREAPRCWLVDCVDMGTRPGMDNSELIIGSAVSRRELKSVVSI